MDLRQGPPAHSPKKVPKVAEPLLFKGALPPPTSSRRPGRPLGAVPEGIILLPLGRIGKDFVGLVDLLELLLCLPISGIDVRMVLARQLPVGLLDLVRRGLFLHSKLFVEILGHPSLFSL